MKHYISRKMFLRILRPSLIAALTLSFSDIADALVIGNSAPFFNPLDLRMEKITRELQEEVMDSIGVMLVRRQVKSLRFRHYQGFNLMTVVI